MEIEVDSERCPGRGEWGYRHDGFMDAVDWNATAMSLP